jgi:hypothetical protein
MTTRRSSRLLRVTTESSRRSGPPKRVRKLIGSLDSNIPDLAEDHSRYVRESLTKSE